MASRPIDAPIAGQARFAIFGAAFPGNVMADNAKQSPAGGTMDTSEHRRTWIGFLKVAKWSVGAILLIMLFMAIFRVH